MSRFLAHYEAYVAKLTDAPTIFGHATGLAILSTIALKRRWLNRGTGIYPNLFMLLTAESSRDRKSTSIKIGMDLLSQCDKAVKRIGPSDFTPEGLMMMLRKKKGFKAREPMILPMSEFGAFLATTNTYASGNSAFLCQLYDGDTIIRVRSGKKPTIIPNPRVSLLGGVAYAMLVEFAKKEDWSTGFFARMLFVTPDARRPQRFDAPPPKNPQDMLQAKAALELLIDELETTANNGGAMDVSPMAEAMFATYANSFADTYDDAVFSPARERLLNSVWKLAMLYQIDIDPNAAIGGLAMERAIDFAKHCWASFSRAFTKAGGSNKARLMMRLWRRLWDHGGDTGLQKRSLYRACHMKLDEFNPAIDELKKVGAVVDVVIEGKPGLKAVEEPSESSSID